LIGRWTAIAQAFRTWALTNQADYGLVFGTPVPGYEAPNDTNVAGFRYTNVVVQLVADATAHGCVSAIEPPKIKGLVGEYRNVKKAIGVNAPDTTLLAGLSAWAAIFGAINLEIFGHVDNVYTNPGIHFAALVDMLGRQVVGLT
jgi:hypothetical protein